MARRGIGSHVLFGLALVGSCLFHAQLKDGPQWIAIAMAAAVLFCSWRAPACFTWGWPILFGWALFGAAMEYVAAIQHWLHPPSPLPPGMHVSGGVSLHWYDEALNSPVPIALPMTILVLTGYLWLASRVRSRETTATVLFLAGWLISLLGAHW